MGPNKHQVNEDFRYMKIHIFALIIMKRASGNNRLFYIYLSISLVISCWIILLTLPYYISRLDIFHSGFRAFWDGLLDNLLEGLKDRLKTTVLSSKANGTVMVYNRAFRGWNQFANDKLNGKAFPASPFHVALYLQHLLEETHSPSVY